MKSASALQRMTRQRRVIMEALNRKNWHPTAEELYGVVRIRAPRISLGTVYRNLDILAREGLIVKIEEAGNQRRYDGNPMPHYHVQCQRCGAVCDIPEHAVNWDSPPRVDFPEFIVTGLRLMFEGICASCARQQESSAEDDSRMDQRMP